MDTNPTVNVAARLPKDLHRQLKKRAERNVRSLNSELIVAVRHYLTGAAPAETPAEAPVAQPETTTA